MARPQLVYGAEDLRVWSVPANISNKKLRTVGKRWSSNLEFRRGANNSSPEERSKFQDCLQCLGLGFIYATKERIETSAVSTGCVSNTTSYLVLRGC
jgi:hypothetical protein